MTLLREMSAADYHADPCDTPSLSSHMAQVITSECEKIAWLEHPKLGGKPDAPTPPMETGTVYHGLILGDAPTIEIIEADSFRTKDARTARDAARAAGKIPLLEKEAEHIKTTAFRIMAELKSMGVRLSGEREGVAIWDEYAANGASVKCRAKIDHFDGLDIHDLKFVEDASPKAINAKMHEYAYAIQGVTYPRAVEALDPSLAGRIETTFLFCMTVEPYCVVPVNLAGTMFELGRMRWERAVNTWERCLRTGEWPGYPPMRVEARGWVLEEEMSHAV